MIRLKKGDFEKKIDNWAKHHKYLSVPIKRVNADGTKHRTKNKALLDILNDPHLTLLKTVKPTINEETNEVEYITFYNVVIENVDYEDSHIEFYETGSTKTSQTLHLRLKFMFESDVAYIDYKVETGGSNSITVSDVIRNDYLIDDTLEYIAEKGFARKQSLSETGIYLDDDRSVVELMVVNQKNYTARTIEVDMDEFKDAFIGVELYKFKQVILNR